MSAAQTNEEIDAAIAARARETSFGTELAKAGVTTVALDEDGKLVRCEPDGTRTAIS